jgi:pyruvate dehydrogenase E2 component (dihydrolipoamide acetyltransferase)
MRTQIVMPQMGESVTEGTVTQWLKAPGEFVDRDEPLFEITTDKVDAEVPSPSAGVLVEQLVEVGQTVEINTVVAILDSEATAGVVPVASTTPGPAAVTTSGAASLATVPASAQVPARTNGVPTRDELRRARSTPLVRRIAAEHGIEDLSRISGSGLSGRVTKSDILAFIESGASAAPLLRRDLPAPPVAVGPMDRVEAMGPQRMAIAEHMIRSRATSAHAHTIHEIDFSRVVAARQRDRGDFEARGGRLTYTAFIVKALVEALRAFPVVNASLDGDRIIYRGEVNIGVAVALKNSLIVPVVRNADELSLLGIARAVEDLATRARTKKLKPEEVQGGTFTLSNHGIYGPEFGVPVINQPQTAILSAGAIKKRVVVDQKTDAIMVRPTAIFCLSFDHRTIDGATADQFLAHLRETLEGWE